MIEEITIPTIEEVEAYWKRPSKTPLINREHVRSFLLDLAKSKRSHKWDRVSEQTLVAINETVRAWCVQHVARFPSKGKTL